MNRKERRAHQKQGRKLHVASPSVAPGFEQRVADAVAAVIHNQKELARTLDSHDAQLAVLTRLVISKLNEMVAAVNAAIPSKEGDCVVKAISFDELSEIFGMLHAFRKRKDYQKHNKTWFMGGDVSNLGPDEELQVAAPPTEEGTPKDPDAQYPEGAFLFGGDHNAEANSQPEESTGREQGDDVPSLQTADSPRDQPAEQEASTLLPQVP